MSLYSIEMEKNGQRNRKKKTEKKTPNQEPYLLHCNLISYECQSILVGFTVGSLTS